jgi:ActR/RegA family two-component response regulator
MTPAQRLILIIEDDPQQSQAVARHAPGRGLRDGESPTTEIDLQIAEQRRPALILMDIRCRG